MAELLILEFEGFGREAYDKVNAALGIDSRTGAGDWPKGLITHHAGKTSNGWIVVEEWASRADQEEFMRSRLGPALHQSGAEKPPSRVEWAEDSSHNKPGA